MVEHGARTRSAFQKGCFHIGRVDRVDDGCAGHADHLCRDDESKGNDRHGIDFQHLPEGGHLVGKGKCGQPLQIDGKDEDRRRGDHEFGYGDHSDRQDGDDAVIDGAAEHG
ncbi:hypothetical protein D3C80_1333510 [compost metagenome]